MTPSSIRSRSEPVVRVLVVEDAATLRLFYRRVLEPEGFTVDEAGNGYEGLEKLASDDHDLVLVDMNMPRMDGCSMVRALRELEEVAELPVLMISTESAPADARLAYESGANLYMVKPVRPEPLLRQVRLLTGSALT